MIENYAGEKFLFSVLKKTENKEILTSYESKMLYSNKTNEKTIKEIIDKRIKFGLINSDLEKCNSNTLIYILKNNYYMYDYISKDKFDDNVATEFFNYIMKILDRVENHNFTYIFNLIENIYNQNYINYYRKIFSKILDSIDDTEKTTELIFELFKKVPVEVIDKEILLKFFEKTEYINRIELLIKYYEKNIGYGYLYNVMITNDEIIKKYYDYEPFIVSIPTDIFDKDIVLEIAKSNGEVYYFLPNELIDKDIILECVKTYPSIMKDVEKEIIDKYIALTAVESDPFNLLYIPKKVLESDLLAKDIIYTAIKKDGLSLHFVPYDMIDLDIAQIAVNQNMKALEYVPDYLKKLINIQNSVFNIESENIKFFDIPKTYIFKYLFCNLRLYIENICCTRQGINEKISNRKVLKK